MKKLTKILLIIILMIVVVGCSISPEEKEIDDPLFIQGKENAIKYIEDKYDFTPEIIKTRCTYNISNSFDNECLDTVEVEAKYNGKTFKIQIDGTKETIEGVDDYQKDEIIKDLVDIITEDFGAPYNYKIYYGRNGVGLISEYYNGYNLYSMFSDIVGLYEYIGHDYFNKYESKLSSTDYAIYDKLYIINYKSESSYNSLTDGNRNFLNLESYLEEELEKYSDKINDALVKNYYEVNYYKVS